MEGHVQPDTAGNTIGLEPSTGWTSAQLPPMASSELASQLHFGEEDVVLHAVPDIVRLGPRVASDLAPLSLRRQSSTASLTTPVSEVVAQRMGYKHWHCGLVQLQRGLEPTGVPAPPSGVTIGAAGQAPAVARDSVPAARASAGDGGAEAPDLAEGPSARDAVGGEGGDDGMDANLHALLAESSRSRQSLQASLAEFEATLREARAASP